MAAARLRAGGGLRAVLAAALGAVLVLPLLAGCNTLVAQNPRSPMQPVNAVRWADEPRLMLAGLDLVAFFDGGGFVQGSPQYRADYEQVSFHFADAMHLARFQADPRAYLPAYHGLCAAAMLQAVPRACKPGAFAIIDGRLFLFADDASKAAFLRDAPANIARADRLWQEQVLGRNAEWQRLQRWFAPLADDAPA